MILMFFKSSRLIKNYINIIALTTSQNTLQPITIQSPEKKIFLTITEVLLFQWKNHEEISGKNKITFF